MLKVRRSSNTTNCVQTLFEPRPETALVAAPEPDLRLREGACDPACVRFVTRPKFLC